MDNEREAQLLAEAIAKHLVASKTTAPVAKAADHAAEDRLAAKIARAIGQPRELTPLERTFEWEGLDPVLAGIFAEPTAEELAKAAPEPTLEELRKACENEGVSPVLAGILT